jgi:hypothetical protein
MGVGTNWAAAKLRALADRLAPRAPAPRSSAPLIRLGGRWWYRGELVSLSDAEDVAS